jgi:Protein of unknown function (DUF2804)
MTRPWRGPGGARPDLPLPPGRMPLVRGGRPLKRWTWVGAFGPRAMLCAAVARVGPFTTAWWAVWSGGELLERTVRRALDVTASRVVVPGVMTLDIDEGSPIEVVSPHGDEYAWTRKRGDVRVRGIVLGRAFEARGLVDESAGYHARHTAWRWSAGVGHAASGVPVAWNLVDGLHDGTPSERTVWLAGEPHEVGPSAFDGLRSVGGLRFTAEATRARRENLLIASSDYEAPFGAFAGELPVAGELRRGWGVMERHAARW